MYHYFVLQQRIIARYFREWGVAPWLGYVLASGLFLALSFYLFYKTSYAPYLYSAIALGLLSTLSEKERNEFLKTQFSSRGYRQIRSLENGGVVLPFVLFLLYQAAFVVAGLLLILAVLTSFFAGAGRLRFTLPTPFYRFPFEYAQGFRQNWALYLLAYFVAWKAVEVNNFNLGVGSLAFLGVLALTHYSKPENEYFVWIYSCTAQQFLLKKIGTACGYLALISMPMLLGLGWFFADQSWILWLVEAVLALFLLTLILAKYSAYPGAISLPQALLLAIALWFPPFLLILIPLFYRRALLRLNVFLT